ncbi:phosphotransferase enzyme family protein [Pseudomonas alkylphenolica]|uniref:phosphotransferase enzyme family protein n=1 Tax=Pseudomonas alkylphenolica TaxID=237609 RepID=UPI0018D92C01|nr:phosphotransferase [Pseudomonas alkylphenolica]MBH3426685.1 phosphotransferase [Pseudomonas alkylphenolica]
MSVFSTLDHDQQVASLQRLAQRALAHWEGDFVSLELIKYRENAVFCATRADGVRSALRVHRAGYHCEASLRSELTWMEQLAAGGIGVPQIIRTREGDHLAHVHSEELAESRHVDMLGWLAGSTMGSAEQGIRADADVGALFFEAGAVAARIHLQSAKWRQPNEFTRHAWDEEGLVGADPLWGRFWDFEMLDPHQRQLIQEVRLEARLALRRYGRTLDNFGMIHADFIPENLMLDGTRLQLIDFDDSGFGWHMFELATALFFCLDDPRFAQIEAALLDGYHSVKPLTTADRAALPLFLALRGMTYLGWLHTRQNAEINAELGPLVVERTCQLAREFLDSTLN